MRKIAAIIGIIGTYKTFKLTKLDPYDKMTVALDMDNTLLQTWMLDSNTNIDKMKLALREGSRANIVYVCDLDSHVYTDNNTVTDESSYSTKYHSDLYDHVSDFSDFDLSDKTVIGVWTRPFAKFALCFLSKTTNLILFTSATQHYTDQIIDRLHWRHHFLTIITRDQYDQDEDNIPAGKNIMAALLLYKQNNIESMESEHRTSNSSPSNTHIRRMLLVDDYEKNQSDGQLFYHIKPYYAEMYDFELLKLCAYVLLRS
jgi:phosphoglycolate phosphatase-like HAD superfamily hydrolase